jgi:hypothetical protein
VWPDFPPDPRENLTQATAQKRLVRTETPEPHREKLPVSREQIDSENRVSPCAQSGCQRLFPRSADDIAEGNNDNQSDRVCWHGQATIEGGILSWDQNREIGELTAIHHDERPLSQPSPLNVI